MFNTSLESYNQFLVDNELGTLNCFPSSFNRINKKASDYVNLKTMRGCCDSVKETATNWYIYYYINSQNYNASSGEAEEQAFLYLQEAGSLLNQSGRWSNSCNRCR